MNPIYKTTHQGLDSGHLTPEFGCLTLILFGPTAQIEKTGK